MPTQQRQNERFVQIEKSTDGKTLSISYWKRESFPHIEGCDRQP
jgi:hypothetical protein